MEGSKLKLLNICCFFGIMFIAKSECLQCYQCSATSAFSPCESNLDQLGDSKNNGGPFSKNCSIETRQHFCLIEKSTMLGKTATFLRDCSDGETLSFSSIPRLTHLAPTNQTTCSANGISGSIVCVSICTTDFCNGPQISGTTNTTSSGYFTCLLVFAQIVLTFIERTFI